MLHAILIGAAAGMRSMTPLAAIAGAAWRGQLPHGHGAPHWAGHPLAAAAGLALAAAASAGEKWRGAPDRVTPPGIAARIAVGALAGAAVSPRDRRARAALIGAAGAIAGGYLSWRARLAAIARWGQVPTGFVEDGVAAAATAGILDQARRRARRHAETAIPGQLGRGGPRELMSIKLV